MKNLAKRFYLSGMLISLAVVFSIMSSLSAQNFEVNLSSTQTNLIEKSKPKTFVIDAGIDYLTKPFDAEIYHHRSNLSDGGKAAFDLIIKDLLDFEPLKEQKNYVFDQEKETISYNLKDFGIKITENEARNFNLVLGFDDSRLINLKFGQYQANKTPRYSDTDGDGFIDTLTLDIVSGYAKDPAKYKDDLLAVEKGLVSVFSRITEDMTDAQRVGVAIGGVYNIIGYGQRDPSKPGNHISILAVLNAKAICGGYSHLNQYVLQRLGLKSLYLEGSNHDKIGHAWNWVEVDGQWYEYEVSFKGASELMYYTDGLISQAYGRGTRSYNFPTLANKGYHYVGSTRSRFVAPGNRVVDTDIMGLSESDLNDVTLSAVYDEKIKQGMIQESAKPTDKEVNNAILTVGSNAIFKQNLIGSRVTSMNINGVLLKIDNNVTIQGNGAFMGGHSQGSGNINDAVVLLGNNNTINVEAHGTLNDSQGGVGGAINNVYVAVENNNVFGKKLTLTEIKNNIKETFDQEVLNTWTDADYEAAMKGTKQWPKKLLENISNANISNIMASFGNNNTFKDFVGARHEGTGNISNVAIGFGNDTTINGNVDIAIANSGNISNIEASFGNNAKIDGNLTGATTTSGNINNTIITLGNNADINGSVVASKTNSGDITNSLIILSGITKVTGDVIGGTANSGNSMGHKIYVHDSVNADRIIGGRILNATNTSKATNNLIYIDAQVNMPKTTLYGGYSDNGKGDVLSGNTLHFSGKQGIFYDIKNFENIEIDASGISQSSAPTGIIGAATSTTPTTPTNTDDAIITLTGTEVTNLDKTNVSLLLDANSNAKNINIFKKASGTITAPKSASAKVLKGVSMIEEFALKMDGNNTLSASWTAKGVAQEKTQNVGTAAISESELLLAGNDAIDLVFLSKSIKSNTLETFGMIRGGNIETTSGANTNTKTVNLIAGVGKNISDNTQYGVFFEGGYGSYTSRSNTIQGASDGKGSNTYYGAGLLFSSNLASRTYRESNRNQASRTESNQAQASNQARTSTSNIYLEASIRLGQIKTDYSSDNLGIENVSRSARFNTTKLYYGGHIGLGNLFKISQKSNIDLYAKAYYGQIGQDSVALGTGDRLSFSAVNSLIGKLGARYNYNIANNFALYAGSSYEYEVLGNIKTLNEIANISYKSLKDKRDTFAIEGGTQIQPINSDNVILNIHAKYLMGARQGIAGSVKGSYRF